MGKKMNVTHAAEGVLSLVNAIKQVRRSLDSWKCESCLLRLPNRATREYVDPVRCKKCDCAWYCNALCLKQHEKAHAHFCVPAMFNKGAPKVPATEQAGERTPRLEARAKTLLGHLRQYLQDLVGSCRLVKDGHGTHLKLNEQWILPYPSQLGHNLYADLVRMCAMPDEDWEALKIREKQENKGERSERKNTEDEAEGGSEDEVEDDDEDEETKGVYRLHRKWQDIEIGVSTVMQRLKLSVPFHTLCLLRLVLDVISDQAANFDCNGMTVDDVADFAPSENEYGEMVEKEKSPHDLLSALETLTENLEVLQVHPPSPEEKNTPQQQRLDRFWKDQLEHATGKLEMWLSDYHESEPQVVARFFLLYMRLMDVSSGRVRPKDDADPAALEAYEFEVTYLRNKQLGKLLTSSANREYERLRAEFPKSEEMGKEDWKGYGEEMKESVMEDGANYTAALLKAKVFAQPHDYTLVTMADLFTRDVKDYLKQHPGVDDHSMKVLPIIADVMATFEEFKPMFSDPRKLADHLPSLDAIYQRQQRGWIAKQASKAANWLGNSLAKETWKPLSDDPTSSQHSVSAVDVFSLLHTMAEVYISTLKLCHFPLTTLKHFVWQVNDIIVSYAELLYRNTSAEGTVQELDCIGGTAYTVLEKLSPSPILTLKSRDTIVLKNSPIKPQSKTSRKDKLHLMGKKGKTNKGNKTGEEGNDSTNEEPKERKKTFGDRLASEFQKKKSAHAGAQPAILTSEKVAVRVSNLEFSLTKIQSLNTHLRTLWNPCKEEALQSGTSKQVVLLAEAESKLTDEEANIFWEAENGVKYYQDKLLKLMAARAVCVEWRPELDANLYSPSPVHWPLRESKLQSKVTASFHMAFNRLGWQEDAVLFGKFTKMTYALLLEAMYWIITKRDAPVPRPMSPISPSKAGNKQAAGHTDQPLLLAVQRLSNNDYIILKDDYKLLQDMFGAELKPEEMQSISKQYETLMTSVKEAIHDKSN
eukprot:g40498.t1